MSNDFEDLSSRVPNIEDVLVQRIISRKPNSKPSSNFDPYQTLLKKKQAETYPIDSNTIKKWPEEDVRKLQDYCSKMGIIGFKSNLPPIVALGLLKKQLGDDYTGVPLEHRVFDGYEKLGSKASYGPNFPYSEAMRRKQILHG